ncbi:MAG TPA: S41 family peptidase, partial [Chondromyces sp.]|nr:S41 family peptidase [Chondromyces sp.]
HGDTVVFVHAEDIWTAPVAGGRALRLTDDEGEERHPKFSPDGSLIAFTSEMDGNPDVFVMGADGSSPRRLTYHPDADEVVGWHPVSGKIMFRSARHSYSRFDRLFLVAPDGTGLEELPLHEAGRGSFSPDGAQIAYNRIAREDRTWKRYYGGMAQDLWLYDFATGEDRRLTDYRGTDRLPMWIGDVVYFASDRNGALNIWRYDLASGEQTQVTRHADHDIRRPSEGGDRIVYEVAGELWLLDTTTGASARIPVEIPTPARETRPYRKTVAEFITHVDIAPAGGRALISARGEVFTVPAEHGPTRNLTRSSGARDRGAVWSPDGTNIAYFSDRGGEYQLYVVDPLGTGEPRALTGRERGWPHTARWSPDGTKIAFADETLRLYVVDVASRQLTTVDRAEVEPMDIGLEAKPISDHAWSPDSRWLAYSKIGLDHVSNIYLYSLDDGVARNVSGGIFNDFGPVFSRDGEHLLFVSNRRFDPTFCDFEWEMVFKDVAGIYALTLRADGEPLLPLRSDEVVAAEDVDREDPPSDAPRRTVVDFDGIAERIQALPVPASNYRDLAVGTHAIYFLDGEEGDFNRFEYRSLPPRTLHSFDLEDRKLETVVAEVEQYARAVDGEHLVWRRGDTVGIAHADGRDRWKRRDAPSGSPAAASTRSEVVDLDGLVMELDPRAEWRQVFDDAWRLERDFYYEPGMNGLDWRAMRAKYEPLVERATCAQDMRFIIGELIGELATSHTYINVGDRRRSAAEVNVGMLGADWSLDPESGRWLIEKIYRVPDWSRGVVPPLVGPGIDVREGDALVAVNGREVAADREVHAAFQGLAGEQVRLTLERGGEELEVVVTPLAGERTLRYLDWVERNRRRVEEASDGRIGYLHLPDTYVGSAIEFPKYYYAQSRKQGLLVDGRFNGGGLDPDIFLQRLAKKPLTYWTRRYSEDQVEPVYANIAHLALLTNRQAGSGGDMLPWEFREKGMGPVIGTRTWGGLVGVSMSLTLVDGSRLTCPDYRIYSPDGEWVVENEGVAPDIEVELEPADMARGVDAQLEKGIEVLLETIERDPPVPPTHPPFPTRR